MITMTPVPYRVVGRSDETPDTVSLTLAACAATLPVWAPGQFTMAYAFGVGEVPISISGGDDDQIVHTVRSVGAVTQAICAAPVGAVLGLRGPFGQGWAAPPPDWRVLVVAGGIGLAPLRPVVRAALRTPGVRLTVLVGARTPDDLIFTDEYDLWRAAGARVLVTVDRATGTWHGHVGVVTTLLRGLDDVDGAVGYVCGPELMMRLSARALANQGVNPADISLSLERNMRCGIGVCGHCQLGPLLVCRDGPVTDYPYAELLMSTKEL